MRLGHSNANQFELYYPNLNQWKPIIISSGLAPNKKNDVLNKMSTFVTLLNYTQDFTVDDRHCQIHTSKILMLQSGMNDLPTEVFMVTFVEKYKMVYGDMQVLSS